MFRMFFLEGASIEYESQESCFIAVSHFEVLYWLVESLFELAYDKGDKHIGSRRTNRGGFLVSWKQGRGLDGCDV